ncbi:MAG: hypothetical protein A2293_08755 [Elusimicrobia bacterium RIFOXYB2_FULL_49_7]|nr:MAG: hypothetical protein A2293_08755 [Elusimicrobia bacterium RIFOXYB2_FULL_49_7]
MSFCHSVSILLIFVISPIALLAAEKEDRWGVGFQPIIGYDDDASWTFGGNSAFYYNPHPEDESQELDELGLTTTVTLNGGANVHFDITKNMNGNARVLNTVFGCERYIDYFYGTDENGAESAKEKYTAIDVPFHVSYSFNALEHLYVSAHYDFLYHDISGEGAEDALLSNELMESDRTHCSGAGIGINYKTTNPGIYKRTGYQVSLTSTSYSSALLSSSIFEYTSLGWRYYVPVLSTCVLGLQLRGETTHGDVPVNYLPSLGGNKLVRGFSGSRYMAENCISGQAEFRFPMVWRLGATVFVGGGEVADSFKDFGSHLKMAGGLGFRVMVQKKQNINIRFDLAYNSDGELMKYIKLKEAF